MIVKISPALAPPIRILLLVILYALATSAGLAPPALAQPEAPHNSAPGKRLGVRLRSFIPNTSGSLYFEPTLAGGMVRLTAINLPAAANLMPEARTFMVWATAAGEKPLRVGELSTDASGNGGLEFARPASFERYSVVVTAELNAFATRPSGIMVFASRAGAVTAFYGERHTQLSESRKKALNRELNRSELPGGAKNDFYAEVDDALKASANGGRVLELTGSEMTPEAHGLARVAERNQNIYVRTVIKKLPLPSRIGANMYVLWGVMPDGRISYMGSLPSNDFSNADTYVRVGGFRSDELDLIVTAEVRRPVARPSGMRAMATRSPSMENTEPAFGAVAGRVVDLDGRPIAGATVDIRPVDQPVVPGALPLAYTDEQGNFFLDGVTPGTHVIFASKEEAGYPSTYLAFFIVDPDAILKVNVNNKQVTESVLVRLGPKAGRLIAHVVDAETTRPVEEAEVIFYREEKPADYFSFGLNKEPGKFEHLLPSLPLRMKISAPGYDDWFYGQDGTKERADILLLAPDTTKELAISLRPMKRGANKE